MKANVILIAGAVIVFVGLYLLFPYTDMGKEAYATNRGNAIAYIQAVKREVNPAYQNEMRRLIEKYDLQDIYDSTDNLSDFVGKKYDIYPENSPNFEKWKLDK